MGREECCTQMSLACVGSTHSVPATLGLPRSWPVYFPHLHCSGSRLLYSEWALSCVHFPGPSWSGSGFWVLHKGADLVGPAFYAFPVRSSSGSQELEEHTLPRCSMTSPSPSPPQFPGTLVRCALCLFWGADLWLRPSWRMSTTQNLRKSLVRNWKPVRSLVGDAVSRAKFTSFP